MKFQTSFGSITEVIEQLNYKLSHPDQSVSSGFAYKTVPHITLKSIANNEPPEQETLYDQPEIEKIQFTRIEMLTDTKFLHGTAETIEPSVHDHKIAVICFAGETKPLDVRIVDQALREAETIRPKPNYLIFAAFQIDPAAAKLIDDTKWPGLTLFKVQMNTDLMTRDLKKKSASSQSF